MNDLWLAQQIKLAGKKFYFIRTKADSDIHVSYDKKAHPRTHSRDLVLHKIRSDCLNQLKNHGFANPEVFIIDSYSINEFDFGQLSERLIRDAPYIEREALAFSLNTLTEKIFRAKERYLRKRIPQVSTLSAVAGSVPIPDICYRVDIAILLEEDLFYQKQLRLDETSLQENAAALNIPVCELQRELHLQSQISSVTSEGLLAFFSCLGKSNLAEDILKFSIPLVGSLIAAGISYAVQMRCLNKLLDAMVTDALSINEKMNIILAGNAVKLIKRKSNEDSREDPM